MENNKICITADCVCDLPENILKKHNIDLVYFYIETETGNFRDVDEITSQNVFEYLMNDGKRSVTKAPPVEEFKDFFMEKLAKYREVIHIGASSMVSMSVANSTEAVGQMGDLGKRVHIFDSQHLSTGMGFLVLKAAELVEKGYESEAVIAELEQMRPRVSTTFMANNADYLYRNGKVSKNVKMICSAFKIHPVLDMKNGFMKLKSIQIGNYEKSALRYIRKELKQAKSIKNELLFVTYSGCSVSDLDLIKKEVNQNMSFKNVMFTKASATVSGNCGPRTFGILFERK